MTPFRDYAHDCELRLAIGRKLLNLVADGVTDPIRLRWLTVEKLLLTCNTFSHSTESAETKTALARKFCDLIADQRRRARNAHLRYIRRTTYLAYAGAVGT